jgi:hypothetical protein
VLNHSLMMTIHTCISSCSHTITFSSLHAVNLTHQHGRRLHNKLTRYVISLTNTLMFSCVRLMNDSAMFKPPFSLRSVHTALMAVISKHSRQSSDLPRKQLLPKTLITPSEKRGQQFLLSPFVEVGLASPRRSNDCLVV